MTTTPLNLLPNARPPTPPVRVSPQALDSRVAIPQAEPGPAPEAVQKIAPSSPAINPETGEFIFVGQSTAQVSEGGDGLTFRDLLDVINPLQHIPVVSTIYRHLTGDAISSSAKVIGGGLFGGPVGLAAATMNAVLKEASGRDAGEHVMALVRGDDSPPMEMPGLPPGHAVAQAPASEVAPTPAPAPTTAAVASPQPVTMAAVDARWFPISQMTSARAMALPDRSAPMVGAPPAASQPVPAHGQPASPSSEAVHRALAAQGRMLRGDHAMVPAAAPALPATPAMPTTPTAPATLAPAPMPPPQSGPPPNTGPVEVPGWFDDAMLSALQRYQDTGRLKDEP